MITVLNLIKFLGTNYQKKVTYENHPNFQIFWRSFFMQAVRKVQNEVKCRQLLIKIRILHNILWNHEVNSKYYWKFQSNINF